jgi:hypothetical protein
MIFGESSLSTLPLGLVLVHGHVEESDAANLKDAPRYE